MRKPSLSAFTLVEMLTVLAIIVILSGLVLGVGGYAQKKAALSRARGEIALLESACESYKSDNGNYPRDFAVPSVTDAVNPKVDLALGRSDVLKKYTDSSLFLYKELTGDKSGSNGVPDGIPDEGQQRYLKEFEPRILNGVKDPATKAITSVNYLQDPFGFPYAYSTSAAADEQTYQQTLLRNPAAATAAPRKTGNQLHGFSPGSYDLWSTGGSAPQNTPSDSSLEWAKWIKSW